MHGWISRSGHCRTTLWQLADRHLAWHGSRSSRARPPATGMLIGNEVRDLLPLCGSIEPAEEDMLCH